MVLSKKKILVTGAAGFIGSEIAKKLLSKGLDVIGIDNLNEYYNPFLKHKRIKTIEQADYNNCWRFIKVNINDAKKAMTPYFTTKKTGTGLGLPIVTKIINEHSGSFKIKNIKKEKGTIITILLPKFNA